MSPLSPHTADSIAGYTLIERIGAGGYGEVWKAEAPGGLEKAVKLVYGYLDDQRAACERKSLNRVKEARHPFLLSVERIEIVDGQLVVVTELADMSLKERYEQCRDEGQQGIPRDELLVYMGDAADALDYMRERHGLQHLDVKPENLLITSGRVKVADFGLVKSLRDEQASLLGGLTPQYAPPELFDGSPSPTSDQYSLAIVYQEMLSGIPPFPGRTAAQLATQHLHSQPQLNPLSASDRDVVGRALSKQPEARFESCRAMIDALRGGQVHRVGNVPSQVDEASQDGDYSSDTSSITGKDTHPTDAAPQPPAPAHGSPSATHNRTLVIDKSPLPTRDTSSPDRAPIELPPATDPVRLAPIDLAAEEVRVAPSLVLGIGGTAATALGKLRQRLHEDGDEITKANVELLLLDTDPSTIDSACGSRGEDCLEYRETMLLPLRPSGEYREQSADHLQWLSRRWLYNIPRSLRTQGRRPLGRLAFADHVRDLVPRIREALLALAEESPGEAAPESPARKDVRVYIVSSVAGGTGSGMVIDVGYLVRQVMTDLGFPQQEICAVLAHSTGTSLDQQELSVANTYACLSELNHYNAVGYPGDPSCGLHSSSQQAFGHTYLVHLGDNLDAAAYAAAVDDVAEYVYLNVTSPVGRFFEGARRDTGVEAVAEGSRGLRTFGLTRFDPHHNEITALAVEELSRNVMDRWLGGGKFFEETPIDEYLARRYPELVRDESHRKHPSARSRKEETPLPPSDEGRGLRLLLESHILQQALSLPVGQHLGEDADGRLREWIKSATVRHGSEAKRGLLKELDRLLTPRRKPDDDSDLPPTDLEKELTARGEELAEETIDSIRRVLVQLTSNPDARISAAQHAAQWFCDRLRQLERATSAELAGLGDRLDALEATLPEKISAGGFALSFGRRKANRSGTWLEYCQLRLHLVIAESIARYVRRVNTQLSASKEHLKVAQFSLSRLADQFQTNGSWTGTVEESRAVDSEARSLSQNIAVLLDAHMPSLVKKLDQTVGDELMRADVVAASADDPQASATRFARVLRSKSWSVLAETLRELDLARRLLTEDDCSVGRVSDCLPEAVPRLPKSGGGKRLLVVCPTTTEESAVREGLKSCEEGEFTLVRGSTSEFALLYEVQDLSLPVVATRLAADRANAILAAGRLHTRIDVYWPKTLTLD